MKGKWAVPVLFSILVLGLFPLNDVFAIVFIDAFDISGVDDFPTGLAFSADGLKMFVVGTENTAVNEFACGSAFDVSTCGFTDAFDVSGEDTFPVGVAFSADGTKMFVVGDTDDDINEYDCTAFDVSTCIVDAGLPFDVSGQDTLPDDVAFSADGLTMFVIGQVGQNVYEYACGSAFDVSTCGFTDAFDVSGEETTPFGLEFSPDGLKMFVVGTENTAVNEFACGSAFDVSTCGFTDSFDVSGQETRSDDVVFSADGLTMFVVGEDMDNVNEYALEVAFDLFSSLAQTPSELIDSIEDLGLPSKVENSLKAPLKNAQDKLDDDNPKNDGGACGKMDAFINQVNAQEGKKLSTEQANDLREAAQSVKDSIGC